MSEEMKSPAADTAKPKRKRRAGRITLFCLRALRNTVLVAWLIAALIATSVAMTAWATYATWQVAQLTYRVGEMAYQHRRAMARAIAKARIRRLTVAIPLIGTAAAGYFERRTYYEWRELYPDGTAGEYACDMAALTADVLDEALQDLPERIRPSERRISAFIPDCERDDT